MPPARKSLPGKRQSMKKAGTVQVQDPSSSRSVRALPKVVVQSSLTPGYTRSSSAGKRREMSEDERDRLVLEMIGMHPRSMLHDITECAHLQIYNTVEAIQGWVQRIATNKGEEVEREVDNGLPTLETLLESHIDLAFDKFTGWALRNAFEVPKDLSIVFPWHKDLDFDRGEYVAQEGIDLAGQVEDLRGKVEQARKLKRKMVDADQVLDRRLAIARQRRAEVAFVKDVVDAAGLSPLPQTASDIAKAMENLHEKLAVISPVAPSAPAPLAAGSHTKSWELGRQAYLNWATNKVVHATKVDSGVDELDDAQTGQNVEALAAGLAQGA